MFLSLPLVSFQLKPLDDGTWNGDVILNAKQSKALVDGFSALAQDNVENQRRKRSSRAKRSYGINLDYQMENKWPSKHILFKLDATMCTYL